MYSKIRLDAIAKEKAKDLHDELYPKNLGDAAKVKAIEVRLVIIAKYEGMATILRELGANVRKIEEIINEEIRHMTS